MVPTGASQSSVKVWFTSLEDHWTKIYNLSPVVTIIFLMGGRYNILVFMKIFPRSRYPQICLVGEYMTGSIIKMDSLLERRTPAHRRTASQACVKLIQVRFTLSHQKLWKLHKMNENGKAFFIVLN